MPDERGPIDDRPRAAHPPGERGGPLGAPRDVVSAWLAASNAADAERLIELSAPDIELVGPRGSVRGRDVLRAWLARAGAQFETERVFSAGDRVDPGTDRGHAAVVVEQHAVWYAPDGQRLGEGRVATHFVVREGRVAFVQRYDSLDEALARAGLSRSD